MRTLAERLIGKHVKGIDASAPGHGVGVFFTDGSGFTVYSSVAVLISSLANASRVEVVNVSERQVELLLSSHGYITISTDWDKHDMVEAYVFRDVDGTLIVENGT
ncbi:MAG: hypothetical protein E5X53_00420 [Mesorhizobium sp.]|uniref:hypothetical protein n=1 Tax=Mesorhizobium sp. TaxID=1871066 RepID=UPI000FE87829|nr:hypothetical protein [Mesorhizobium sp.]RWM23904.1 MAG: hypothetical protein EOR73_01100 [Mesorhizobium sp.]TIP69505.1 MAG: hypothetical protein E5X55_31900 [Mesorhizobium sp.]TIQ14881.1 MAG: hypothetical protein E5X57_02760 [Mesorhizobium sp.]TIR54336.1 MAG: hypothetical protein E5X53_00420 [Mesorhizobium sp.]TJV99906.1 MAG: hypothetical protein E5X52_04480 [Mesorhizobium sp.]